MTRHPKNRGFVLPSPILLIPACVIALGIAGASCSHKKQEEAEGDAMATSADAIEGGAATDAVPPAADASADPTAAAATTDASTPPTLDANAASAATPPASEKPAPAKKGKRRASKPKSTAAEPSHALNTATPPDTAAAPAADQTQQNSQSYQSPQNTQTTMSQPTTAQAQPESAPAAAMAQTAPAAQAPIEAPVQESNRSPASPEPAVEEAPGIMGQVARHRMPLLATLAVLAAGIGGLAAWKRRNSAV